MRIPRDLFCADLIKRLSRFGYAVTRQTGIHLRLTSQDCGKKGIVLNQIPLYAGVKAPALH